MIWVKILIMENLIQTILFKKIQIQKKNLKSYLKSIL